MFRFVRLLGNITIWAVAAVGVVAALFWVAAAAGLVQPLIVISGSMEPGIGTGDLLLATRTDTADLHVGDVVSLPSEQTQHLVTHRIVTITPLADGQWEIEMKGDANPGEDISPYVVGDRVWQPAVRLPGVGSMMSSVMQTRFMLSGIIALVAFFGFAVLSDDDDEADDDDADENDDENDDVSDDGEQLFVPAAWPAPSVDAHRVRELEVASR